MCIHVRPSIQHKHKKVTRNRIDSSSTHQTMNKRKVKKIEGCTLYDKILKDSENCVYDLTLGEFLPKKHPVVVASLAAPVDLLSHQFFGFDSEFAYVKVMVVLVVVLVLVVVESVVSMLLLVLVVLLLD